MKMPNRNKRLQNTKKQLDALSPKRGRGRPRKALPSEVFGRTENYRWELSQVWPRLRDPLLAADRTDGVIRAFETYAEPYAHEFVPRLASDILEVIHEPKFPKRAAAQVKFLADSVAGRPNISARRSRDICAREFARERAKSPYRIIRKEFYIVCSCGYKGPAQTDGCPKCGAQISHLSEMVFGPTIR